MLGVSEFIIYSAEEDEEILAIEGEVTFDNDHSTAFSATVSLEDNTLESTEFELEPDEFDTDDFRTKVVEAAKEFED